MKLPSGFYKVFIVFLVFVSLTKKTIAQTGMSDTLVTGAIIYNGDTIEAKSLAGVYVWSYRRFTAREKWTRLRNAVYVTYPYAKRAAFIINDINAKIAGMKNDAEISKYINSREKDIKKQFTEPITNLSVYQGRILMKLINRETGNNCYYLLKDYKGGFTARFWQTVAFFFGSNLKQPYDAKGEDAEIEKIVKEVQRMYGYTAQYRNS